MYDTRHYTDTYDLYRPTVATSATGEKSLTDPESATASSQPCRFSPGRGKTKLQEEGLELEYDAQILVPSGTDIRPIKRDDSTEDKVKVTKIGGVTMALWFRVTRVVYVYGQYLRCFLKEVPSA